MSVSDEQALLHAVWAEPDDDAPRLVYADWLEENGQTERAEFIRVQCQRAQGGEPQRDREEQLLSVHRNEWLAELRSSALPWRFHRGFVERLAEKGLFVSRYPMPADTAPDVPPLGISIRFTWYIRFHEDGIVEVGLDHNPPAEPSWCLVWPCSPRSTTRVRYQLHCEGSVAFASFELRFSDWVAECRGTVQGTSMVLEAYCRMLSDGQDRPTESVVREELQWLPVRILPAG